MKRINSQKGQALILIALAIVGLVGFTALTVDGGRVLEDRRHAQNAADTSVLAAALAKIRGQDYEQAARDRATDNGYTNNVDGAKVEVILCNAAPVGDECLGLPAGATPAEYIRVRIHSFVPTTFARVLGRTQVENTVEAIARAQGTLNSNNIWGNQGWVSVSKTDDKDCLKFTGNANIYFHDSGMYVNCTNKESLTFNGGFTMTMDDDAKVAGCSKVGDGYGFNGDGVVDCDQPQQNISESTFADVPTMPTTPTCSGSYTLLNYTPGNIVSEYTVGKSPVPDVYDFEAGTYCFTNGFVVKNTAEINGPSDKRVTLVLTDAVSTVTLAQTNDFGDLEIYTNNANVRITGALNAKRLRFYSSGTGDFSVDTSGVLTSDNAYLYSYRGTVSWTAQSYVNIKAPPQDDAFGVGGLLIYLPWGNTGGTGSAVYNMNGGTDIDVTGTILMPSRNVVYNGASDAEIHGKVISNEATINGSNNLDIYYKPEENYIPPNKSSIEWTK